MRVILVDDEELALIRLKTLLERDVGGIEVVSIYCETYEVIAGVIEHQPDVVFLDIHMPGISGLDLGRQIQVVVPGTEIVFITSFDRYAVRAFELYALDYIMKPVQINRLQQTVLRVQEKLNLKATKKIQDLQAPLICCFNQIQFQLPGEDPQTVKWRTSKAQELFAYLLYHRDRTIDRSVLLELLWPDFEEAKAAQQLYNTIYNIRQTLRSCGMDMVTIRSGDLEAGYKLDIGNSRIDIEEWEYGMKQLSQLNEHNVEIYEQVLGLYQGDYLGTYEYIWAAHERERYRLLWLHHMRKLSEFYEQQRMLQKVIQVNQRIQQLLPDEEESYFSLMKLYDATGDRIRVEEQYLRLTSRVEWDLESTMDEEIKDWYNQWKLNQ